MNPYEEQRITNAVDEQLQEYIDEELGGVFAMRLNMPQEQVFHVDDESKAIWAVRQIKKNNKQAEDTRRKYDLEIELVQRELDELTYKRDKAVEALQGNTDYFMQQLDRYIEGLPPDEVEVKKTQKNVLIGGTKFVKKLPVRSPEIVDESKVIEYLKDYEHELVNTKTSEKVKFAEFKKRLVIVGENVIDKDTGSIVPGLGVKTADEVLKMEG